jgi:hypothetical protein
MPNSCPKNVELTNAVNSILAKIVELTTAQLTAFQNGQHAEMMRLDKQLENAIGEKERSIGALSEHRKEHAC